LETRLFAENKLLATPRTEARFLTGHGTGDQGANFAALQTLFPRGDGGRGTHDVPSVTRSPTAGRAAPSAHSILSHTSRGSKLAWIAASRKTSTQRTNKATPGITVA